MDILIKVMGLAVILFLDIAFSQWMGYSDRQTLFGAVLLAGTYLIILMGH